MNRQQMRDFVAAECLITGDEIQLSGGGAANFYFDCKRATLRGEFLSPLADWVLNTVYKELQPSPNIVGGPTIGADFIAAAVALRAAQQGIPLTIASIVRKEPKKHGTKSMIENEPAAASRILIVEDVITTGGSIAKACDEFIAAGHSIAAIAAIIDRKAGGVEALEQKYNAPVFALFTKDDFGV
ncbi:MAG: orotate phosphoribosyltransferase [Gammaproteobacteria bacterium WSBS_2016_MAG_OTU1]